jgi:hypothetical protein
MPSRVLFLPLSSWPLKSHLKIDCAENKGVILKREIQIKELQDILPKHAAEPENHEDGLYI